MGPDEPGSVPGTPTCADLSHSDLHYQVDGTFLDSARLVPVSLTPGLGYGSRHHGQQSGSGGGIVRLEEVKAGASLEGVLAPAVVTVVAAVPIPPGAPQPDALQLMYRLPDGSIRERLLGRPERASNNACGVLRD